MAPATSQGRGCRIMAAPGLVEPRVPGLDERRGELDPLCGRDAERPKLVRQGVAWLGGPPPVGAQEGEVAVKRGVEKAQGVAAVVRRGGSAFPCPVESPPIHLHRKPLLGLEGIERETIQWGHGWGVGHVKVVGCHEEGKKVGGRLR
eukprot:CAMPEP_0174922332 /NCGR_PEP_ID=MMETSP1355-20121228/5801_1 /TAXON_ID=464990 /ORGANISM="Hemiselmis tepida, Strain CCMP443" /LENGTH=146 /DNA_ID=CAMNT_0016167907 /DNA_START=241 /DNA_END=682 /DNA_ORIENTATION=-